MPPRAGSTSSLKSSRWAVSSLSGYTGPSGKRTITTDSCFLWRTQLLPRVKGSHLAKQISDTIGTPLVLFFCFTRPTAERGLTGRFYLQPMQFRDLGVYFSPRFVGSHLRPPVKLGGSQDACRFRSTADSCEVSFSLHRILEWRGCQSSNYWSCVPVLVSGARTSFLSRLAFNRASLSASK
jgi:hypothetical protein